MECSVAGTTTLDREWLFSYLYVLNLKIVVVLKASRAVLIRRFSLNEAPFRLFKFISDYCLIIFFNIIAIFFWINSIQIICSIQIVHTLVQPTLVIRCIQPDWGFFFKNCDQSLIKERWRSGNTPIGKHLVNYFTISN